MLEAGVLVIGVVYMVATLLRRPALHRAQPAAARRGAPHEPHRAHRLAGPPARSSRSPPPAAGRWRRGGCCCGGRRSWSARRSCCSGSSAPCSARRSRRTARCPAAAGHQRRPVRGALVRHRPARPGRAVPGHRRLAGHPARSRCSATLLGTLLGTALGLVMGYFGGIFDPWSAGWSRRCWRCRLVIVAFLFIVALGPSTSTLIVVVGFIFTPLIARTVRSAVLVERHLDYLPSARLLGEKPVHIMFVEILPNVLPASWSSSPSGSGTRSSPWPRCRSSASGSSPRHPTGAPTSPRTTACLPAGYWWETLFPALAIASLVVASTWSPTRSSRCSPRDRRRHHRRPGRRGRDPTRPGGGTPGGHLPGPRPGPAALRDVSFQIGRSESYGLVGESGSGKSTVALALTRYLPRNGGVDRGLDQHQRDGSAGHGPGRAA